MENKENRTSFISLVLFDQLTMRKNSELITTAVHPYYLKQENLQSVSSVLNVIKINSGIVVSDHPKLVKLKDQDVKVVSPQLFLSDLKNTPYSLKKNTPYLFDSISLEMLNFYFRLCGIFLKEGRPHTQASLLLSKLIFTLKIDGLAQLEYHHSLMKKNKKVFYKNNSNLVKLVSTEETHLLDDYFKFLIKNRIFEGSNLISYVDFLLKR